jgi:hypothetical protein
MMYGNPQAQNPQMQVTQQHQIQQSSLIFRGHGGGIGPMGSFGNNLGPNVSFGSIGPNGSFG